MRSYMRMYNMTENFQNMEPHFKIFFTNNSVNQALYATQSLPSRCTTKIFW